MSSKGDVSGGVADLVVKPKNPKAATKKENKGEEQSQPSPEAPAIEDVVEAAEIAQTSPVEELPEIIDAEIAPEAEDSIKSSSPEAAHTPENADVPAINPVTRTPSATSLIFGGLIAGAIGFLVATFLPNGFINQSGDAEATLSATVEAQSARIDDLTGQVESLSAEFTRTGDGGIDQLNTKVSELDARMETLAPAVDQFGQHLDQIVARLEALEARPIINVEDGGDAMAAQLDAFRSELNGVTEAARAEIEEAKSRAAEIVAEADVVAAEAQRRAVLAEIGAALENGAPFANTLSKLEAAPVDLVAVADDGAPTLASLRSAFPELARAALNEELDAPENAGTGEKLTAFLRRQTNARSLSAREGDDVDAILSRAESNLQGAEVSKALSELGALSEGSQAIFAEWILQAESRIAAVSAFASISSVLN